MDNTLHKDRTKAIICMIATAVLWSFGGMLIKIIIWNAVAIAGMRSAIAALVLFIYIRKVEFKFSRRKIGAIVAYSATVIFFVIANKLTTSANAILLQYTAPIYIASFGSLFLNEKTSKEDWISIFIILLGVILFFIDKINAGNLLGNFFGICSGISFAFMTIFMRTQKDESPAECVFWGNVLTAIISIPFMFQSMPNGRSWMGLILLGVFQLGLAYVFYSMAIKHISALEAVLIPVIEPILNPVWVFLSVGEKPGMFALIGGVIVLMGVTIRSIISITKCTGTD